MKLESGKVYVNGLGQKVHIVKAKWDCGYKGYWEMDGGFAGYYNENGDCFGDFVVMNLISEIS